MRHRKLISFSFVLLFLAIIVSCTPSEEKTDEYYFQALRSIQDGEKEEAISLFEKGIRNSSAEISRLCSLFLSEVNKKKAIEIMEAALKRFPEDNAVNCRYMAVLYENGKYEELLDFSEKKKDFLGKDNEYIKYRLLTLAKTGNDSFNQEFIDWMKETRFTSYHIEFLDEWYKDSSFTEYKYFNEDFYETFQLLINIRRNVYAGNYSKAYASFTSYCDLLRYKRTDEGQLNKDDILKDCTYFLISDIGKACLYGSSNKYEDALLFSRTGIQADTSKKNTLFFYAGRLLDKSGSSYRPTALENFRTAYSLSPDDASRDNALWYYLETSRNISLDKAVTALNELASSWYDPEYYDDFLNDLAVDLLSSGQFDLFCRTFERNKNFFSSVSYSKYAYISGRLIEEGFCESISESKENYIKALYESAWEESGDNLYYRLLLADKLGKTEEEFYRSETAVLERNNTVEEQIADGFLRYGLNDRFFTYYKENAGKMSEVASIDYIGRISEMEADNKDRYADILRLATTGLSGSANWYRKDLASLIYPRFFMDSVREKCETYKVPEYLLYALMRSESYFDYDVYSSAGAIGLCQLMEETAADIARKLKISDYDLLDAETNMTFGTYYLSELTGRLDGKVMSAVMSYNCGITRVRKWQEARGNYPVDLFIETVPIEETREYARKILTAGCMYGNLYYSMSFSEIIDELFRREPKSVDAEVAGEVIAED